MNSERNQVIFQRFKCDQLLCRLLLTAALCTSAATAFAQQGFESKISDLIRATDEARTRINASAQQQSVGNDTAFQPIEAKPADTLETSSAAEASEIRKRLQLLRRLRLNAPKPKSIPMDAPRATPPRATPPRVDEGLTPLVSLPEPPSTDDSAGLKKVESSIASQITEVPSITDNPPMIQSQQILDSAVDLLQLGESLYRTQNYAAAIRSFESIDETKLSLSDQSWLELMTALCRRALGDNDKAQATLRDLANSDGADYTVPLAKWWLAHSEVTDTVKSKLQEVENQLSPLKQRIDAHVQPSL